jgi:hypothetical protein
MSDPARRRELVRIERAILRRLREVDREGPGEGAALSVRLSQLHGIDVDPLALSLARITLLFAERLARSFNFLRLSRSNKVDGLPIPGDRRNARRQRRSRTWFERRPSLGTSSARTSIRVNMPCLRSSASCGP